MADVADPDDGRQRVLNQLNLLLDGVEYLDGLQALLDMTALITADFAPDHRKARAMGKAAAAVLLERIDFYWEELKAAQPVSAPTDAVQ